MRGIVVFCHIRKTVFDNYLCRKSLWLPGEKEGHAENTFRKIGIYDIIRKQPEVAKKQIQVGGRIYNKTVYSCQKEDDKNEFF